MIRVRVPERGYADVEKETWAALQASRDFGRLHSEGVVEVSFLPSGGVRLRGTCYVGHAICGEVILDFCEKIDGALKNLLSFASHNAFRLSRAKTGASELGDLISLLVDQLLDAVTRYTSGGRRFQYRAVKSSGSLVGGKLDITRSIQLRARGLGHVLAFEKNVATYATPINRIILAALSEVERLSRIVRLPATTIAKSRSLSMLFADCRDHEVLYRQRSYFASEALRHSEMQSDDLLRDIAYLAGVVLAHESFDATRGQSYSLPRTWFLNLENLFESAVRNILAGACPDANVSRGGLAPPAIFSKESREYRANPDLVIKHPSRNTAIGDVKYKFFDGSAAAGDVYQLLVHADAFGAKEAFLVFPGEVYSARELGASRGGIRTTFFSVRLQQLREDLRLVADHLGYGSAEDPKQALLASPLSAVSQVAIA